MNTTETLRTISLHAFRAWMSRWFGRLFRNRRSHSVGHNHDDPASTDHFHDITDAPDTSSGPETIEPAATSFPSDPDESPRKKHVGTRTGRTKTQVRPDMATFSDLLDGIDGTFKDMSVPPIKGGWLQKSSIRAIHAQGVYVASPWLLNVVPVPSVNPDKLPSIAACVLVAGGKYDTEDMVCPRYAFAIKQPRLPDGVQPMRGTPYQFGYCVQLNEKEHDRTSPPRTFWMWAWVVVCPDGVISVPWQYVERQNTITHKRKQWNGKRSSAFTVREKSDQKLFENGHKGKFSDEENKRFLMCVFRQLLIWWTSRAERWSVGVRKDGHRVTFSIAPEHTAHYFADRNRMLTEDGVTKKIIHYVREHTRENGSVVRAHVRGLREFKWKGYDCFVTAPDLNGSVFSAVCDLSPVELPKSEKRRPGFLSTRELAVELADEEDWPTSKSRNSSEQVKVDA